MPAVPSNLSLDLSMGPQIVAAEHNNNYTAIQSAVNALIAILDGGSISNVLTLGGSGPDWAAPATVGYGTSLPGSPTDGQEYVLVDNVQTPTYQWRFRYNSGSNLTYKWEFVGGAPAMVEVATAESTASTTYVALATAGPSFALPRAGVYIVRVGHRQDGTAVVGWHSFDIGGTGAVDADAATTGPPNVANTSATGLKERKQTFASAVTLTSRYRSSAGTATFAQRTISVQPVAV